jgi:hypothetical protein
MPDSHSEDAHQGIMWLCVCIPFGTLAVNNQFDSLPMLVESSAWAAKFYWQNLSAPCSVPCSRIATNVVHAYAGGGQVLSVKMATNADAFYAYRQAKWVTMWNTCSLNLCRLFLNSQISSKILHFHIDLFHDPTAIVFLSKILEFRTCALGGW